MRISVGTLAAVSVLAAILLLLAASKAAATPPERGSIPPPIDVLDWYVGAVNMNRCCDCHTTVCK